MSIIVYSWSEIKNNIVNNIDTHLILGQDITINTTGGALIPSSVTDLIIDGKDPITGENHKITDYNSAAITDTIYSNARATILNMTVKNCKLLVRNYYGLVGVVSSSTSTNIYINYENVIFEGVQVIHNRYGKATFKDCDITIDKFDSSCVISELAEINDISFEGNINIYHTATSNSFIYFLGTNPKVTFKQDSIVNITTTNRELFYADTMIDIIFEPGCYFNATTAKGLFYANTTLTHQARSFTVGNNSTIIITQTQSNNSSPTIRINNDLTIGHNTIFNVFHTALTTSALISFTKNAILKISNPKNVVLYKAYGPMFSFTNGDIKIDTNQLNYWNTVTDISIAGDINDMPTYAYKKSDNSNVLVDVTYSSNSVTNITSNILEIDEGYPLNQTTFNLSNVRVLSMGILEYQINFLRDNKLIISGQTDPISQIQIQTPVELFLITSLENGDFSATISNYLNVNDVVNFLINKHFLHIKTIKYVNGSLSMKIPNILIYKTRTLPLRNGIINRQTQFSIEIKDTRVNGSDFNLYASVTEPLFSNYEVIDDGVIFIESGHKTVLDQNLYLIYHGNGNQTTQTITILEYEDLEGILIELRPYNFYIPDTYLSSVNWVLEEEQSIV